MNDHPDLMALLRGDLSNAEVTQVADHLDRCEECRQDLAETAVGHALLTRTTRTLRRSAPLELPDVPPLYPSTSSRRRRARLRPLALVAAAVALVVGTAVVTQWAERPTTPPTTVATAERTADLEPVDGTGSGRVLMAEDSHEGVQMTVETRGLPKTGHGQFYEAWLFDPKTQKMLALGVVGPAGKASFEVPDSLVGRYQVVDVSLERDDGNPGHSVTSVLRATYA
jgi:Anti-sigma-K factor rskA, C-terminal/Putative zinc-finger